MPYILIADDDLDDCFLAEEAWKETTTSIKIQFVHDGKSLLKTLNSQPLPQIVLLDLNMPIMDGREALKRLRSNKKTCEIPVIILSTSNLNEDIHHSYAMGANSFIHKPSSFNDFVSVMQLLTDYWLRLVELPESSFS